MQLEFSRNASVIINVMLQSKKYFLKYANSGAAK